ncbi:MAG: hypothetical protein JRN58_00190 [Nitrososphaerota archaeon]|nr:hypothetical protein [Nitrososphaerota archaeon]
MNDFDALLSEVLRSKPEISRESLMERIQEKRRTVGSGYLTDQGALFLVAGELGVGLQHMVTTDLTLKDLHLGANDITVIARVLAVYPVTEFKKKDGSGVGHYRRVSLFDQSGVGRLTIWEDNEEAMRLAGISADTPVRVVSAYVKQGLDGKPNLNLGKRGRIEVITDSSLASRLAPLQLLTKQANQVREGEAVPVVDGLAATDSRRSTFTRRDDGSAGSLTQFELKCPGEKTIRVVIWDGVDLPDVRLGSKVRVTNLRQRKGRQGESELHGDSGTIVQLVEEVTSGACPLVKVVDVGKHASARGVDLEVMALSRGTVHEVKLKDGSTTKKGEVVVGDDTGEITAVAWGEDSRVLGDIQAGERLRVCGATIQVSKMGVETLELRGSSVLERLH